MQTMQTSMYELKKSTQRQHQLNTSICFSTTAASGGGGDALERNHDHQANACAMHAVTR